MLGCCVGFIIYLGFRSELQCWGVVLVSLFTVLGCCVGFIIYLRFRSELQCWGVVLVSLFTSGLDLSFSVGFIIYLGCVGGVVVIAC